LSEIGDFVICGIKDLNKTALNYNPETGKVTIFRLIPPGGLNSLSLVAEPYKNNFAKLFEKPTIPRRLCLEVVY